MLPGLDVGMEKWEDVVEGGQQRLAGGAGVRLLSPHHGHLLPDTQPGPPGCGPPISKDRADTSVLSYLSLMMFASPGSLLLAVLCLSAPGAHHHLMESLKCSEADLGTIGKLGETGH